MLKLACLACFFTLIFPQRSGLWLTRFTLLDAAEIKKAERFLISEGITDAFIQVRGRSDAYYKSSVEANQKDEKTDKNLRRLLAFCKENSIRTHAWINVFLLASTKEKLASQPQHILHQKPNWIDHFRGYRPIQVDIQTTQDLKDNGRIEGLFAAPIFDDFITYNIQLVHELLEKFSFDGIHLDYMRFAGESAGYHPKLRRAFTKQTGYYIEKENPSPKIKTAWANFRAAQISHVLSELKHKTDPTIWSVAVKPNPSQAKFEFGQDWQAWLDAKLVDFVVPMNYYASDNLFYSNITSHFKNNERIWVGLATYNTSLAAVQKRLKFLQNEKYNYVIFSFNDLSEKNVTSLGVK